MNDTDRFFIIHSLFSIIFFDKHHLIIYAPTSTLLVVFETMNVISTDVSVGSAEDSNLASFRPLHYQAFS